MSVALRRPGTRFQLWWWSVDRWGVMIVLVLIGVGVVLSLAASPAIAERIDLDPYHFAKRHILFVVPSILLLIGVSMLSAEGVRRVSVLVLLGALAAMLVTLLVGMEIKGARRWLHLGPFALQPSEFVKPAFVIVSAALLARWNRQPGFPGGGLSLLLFVVVAGLLIAQPDIGQTALVGTVWAVMFFVAGLPMVWTLIFAGTGAGLAVSAYWFMPHARARVDSFLNPEANDSWQVTRSLEAFQAGGVTGTGPGGGEVKHAIPDAHADFVFAVVGEEFGLVSVLVIMGLILALIFRGFVRALSERDHFVQLAATGLVTLVGLQAVINMGVNMGLMPAKGMTLPFISYGGSSILALSLAMGFLFALTRRRQPAEMRPEELL